MIDEQKKKILIFLCVGLMMIVMIGLSWTLLFSPKTEKDTTIKQQELNTSLVLEFLNAYYTKTDLGENQNRYKPFMTESMYQQEINKENEPTNQSYKGFVVDFTFDSAEIYINKEELKVIVLANYSNTLLASKGNYSNAQVNVKNKANLRITYKRVGDELLIDEIENLMLVSNSEGENSVYTNY
ncbi:TPA: hypothetical protein ACGO3M_000505 [Streptococcus suis]